VPAQELTLLEAAIIGALQGLFEWLPISSSGQLALILTLALGLDPARAYSLSISAHAGTALSGALITRREILDALHGGPWARIIIVPLAAGTPVALTVDKLLAGVPGDAFNLLIGLLLLATTIILLTTPATAGTRTPETLTLRELALVGVLQGLAALPGLSRSAITLAALLALHLKPLDAVRTSIAIGTAATGAAGLYKILTTGGLGDPATALTITLASFTTGLLSAGLMIGLARRYNQQIAIFTLIIAIIAILSGLPLLT